MNVSETLSRFNEINLKFKSIFHQLDSFFPQLEPKEGGTTFSMLRAALSSLTAGILSDSGASSDIADFNEKYAVVFSKLNEKINDLNSLDEMIAEIKEDSEHMELIALNAMVISVKSGEKGLAFSRITENLQRLSKDMFVYSDKLSEGGGHLLEQINLLKSIFSVVINSQKAIASKNSECAADARRVSENVEPVIAVLSDEVESIHSAMKKIMSVTDERAALAGNFSLTSKALNELCKYNVPQNSSDEELDYVCFALRLYEKICPVLSHSSLILSTTCSNFSDNWSQVLDLLDSVDSRRMDFESRFLDSHAFGNDNIKRQISSVLERHRFMLGEFNKYQGVQKDLQSTCLDITARAKAVYAVYESLRPVMSRLHHVRILQQIEVSKNDAIKSVQDSVIDMDHLISSANKSLNSMQMILESFIQDTDVMLKNFTVSIARDNEEMLRIRNEKERLCVELEDGEKVVSEAEQNLVVLSDDFRKKCVVIQQNLQDLMRLNSDVNALSGEIDDEKERLSRRMAELLAGRGIEDWKIRNSRYLDSIAQI